MTSNPVDVLTKMRQLYPETPEDVYAERDAANQEIRKFLHKQKEIKNYEAKQQAGLAGYNERRKREKEERERLEALKPGKLHNIPKE